MLIRHQHLDSLPPDIRGPQLPREVARQPAVAIRAIVAMFA
jgi:hypothetical protein